eukprot:scaffold347_cov380-Prasinococcus_capsulatus_cf.AAC.1
MDERFVQRDTVSPTPLSLPLTRYAHLCPPGEWIELVSLLEISDETTPSRARGSGGSTHTVPVNSSATRPLCRAACTHVQNTCLHIYFPTTTHASNTRQGVRCDRTGPTKPSFWTAPTPLSSIKAQWNLGGLLFAALRHPLAMSAGRNSD